MCYDPQVMLRERCSCAISERPTSFSVSPLPLCPLCSCLCDLCVTVPFSSSVDCRLSAVDCFSPLTPLFPLDTSHSPVTPLFPLDTQNRGTRVCVVTGLDAASILPEGRSAGWPI